MNDGRMTSSPGWRSSRSADISSACVHEVVSSAAGTSSRSVSKVVARLVNGPSPESGPPAIASLMYRTSDPARLGRLNGIARRVEEVTSQS